MSEITRASRDGTVASGTIASRLDPTKLRQVGVRGLMEELLAALDSTAVRLKLRIALWAGLLAGCLASLLTTRYFTLAFVEWGLGWLPALGLLLVILWLTGVLTQITFSELSRLRPARWADGVKGLTGLTCRLVFLQGGGWCVLAAVILLSRWLPAYWLTALGDEIGPAGQIGIDAAAVVCVLIEASAWLFTLLLLSIAPMLVVERCSILAGLWKWLSLVWRHLGHLLLAEGLALGIGLLLSGPAGLIVWILHMHGPDARLVSAVVFARSLVAGMAGSLLLAYLVVANVFIYLHFRYEANGQR